MERPDKLLDVAIVGGGLAGVVALAYARRAGLEAIVLERKCRVGALWRDLPAWQDIQISPADWTLGDLPLRVRRSRTSWPTSRHGSNISALATASG